MFAFYQGALLFFVAVVVIIVITNIIRHITRIDRFRNNNKDFFVTLDVVASDNADFNHEFELQFSKYRTLNIFLAFSVVIIIIATGLICARPGANVLYDKQMSDRDVMLCLDVSESVLLNDRKILDTYKSIIQDFSGERIGLQIFNSSSRIVFPLTNDYDLVNSQLSDAISALTPVQNSISVNALDELEKQKLFNFLSGTTSRSDSVSLVSDGLVQCALPLIGDSSTSNRSVIFATDNYSGGTPKFSIEDATKLLADNNISLFSIYTGDASSLGLQKDAELKNATLNNKGYYYSIIDSGSVQKAVADAETQTVNNLSSELDSQIQDNPTILISILMCAFLLYFAIRWRLKN